MNFERAALWTGVTLFSLPILFFVAGAFYFAFWPDVRDFVAPQRFTVEHWRQAGYENLDTGYYRWRMRHSLTRQYDLVGMSRAELEALLGPGGSGSSLSYNLGSTGHGIDYGVLELHLDENDKVESYEFRQH